MHQGVVVLNDPWDKIGVVLGKKSVVRNAIFPQFYGRGTTRQLG